MKKSDIYEVAVKILGLYLFVIVIGFIRDLLTSYAMFCAAPQNQGSYEQINWLPFILVSLFNFLLLTFFASLLIFKTKAIVRKICSSADFEETAQLFADRKVIYEIALTLMGLVLIVWTLPDFAFNLVTYVQIIQSDLSTTKNNEGFLITAVLKVGIGLYAIIKAHSLSILLADGKRT